MKLKGTSPRQWTQSMIWLLVALIAPASADEHGSPADRSNPIVAPLLSQDHDGVTPPSTDLGRLRIVFGLQRMGASVIDSAYENNFGFLEVFDQQGRFASAMDKDGVNSATIRNRFPALDIAITTAQPQAVQYSYQLSDSVIAEKRAELLGTLGELPENGAASVYHGVVGALANELRTMDNGTAERLLGMLRPMMAKEKIPEIQNATTAEAKARILQEAFPAQLPQDGRFSRYGLPNPPTPDQVGQAYLNYHQRGERVRRLIELSWIVKQRPGEDAQGLRDWLAADHRELLQRFTDKAIVDAAVADIGKDLQAAKVALPQKEVAEALLTRARAGASRANTAEALEDSMLTLREVPPAVAILRGCVGQDCGSKNVPLFANDPNERIFFITDSKGQLKGYLSGSIVQTEGKTVMQVRVLNGPSITGKEARSILYGLDHAKQELGVGRIMLLTEPRVDPMINYSGPGNLILELVRKKEAVQTTHPNPTFRSTLENHGTGQSQFYNHSVNAAAVPLPSDPQFSAQVKIKVIPASLAHTPTPEPTRSDLLSLMLRAELHGRLDEGQRIGLAAGLTQEQVTQLTGLFQNSGKTDDRTFRHEFVAMLDQLGAHGEAMVSANPDFLLIGRFNTPLAATGSYSDPAVRDLMKTATRALRDGPVLPSNVAAFIGRHPREFLAEPGTVRMFEEMADGNWKKMMRLDTLADHASGVIPSAVFDRIDERLKGLLFGDDLYFAPILVRKRASAATVGPAFSSPSDAITSMHQAVAKQGKIDPQQLSTLLIQARSKPIEEQERLISMALDDPSPEVRRTGHLLHFQSHEPDEKSIQLYASALHDADPYVRATALEIFDTAVQMDPASRPRILRYLRGDRRAQEAVLTEFEKVDGSEHRLPQVTGMIREGCMPKKLDLIIHGDGN